MQNQKFLNIVMSFNLTSRNLQEIIEDHLEKKGNKTILGPKNIDKMIIFIDDLNLVENNN